LLGLGTAARMNYPSRASGNWVWRCTAEALTPALQARLAEFTAIYGRAPEKPEEEL
jgi:4-alpha-glucanotransferase